MPGGKSIALWCQEQSRGAECLRRLLLHCAVLCEVPEVIDIDLQDIVSGAEVSNEIGVLKIKLDANERP